MKNPKTMKMKKPTGKADFSMKVKMSKPIPKKGKDKMPVSKKLAKGK